MINNMVECMNKNQNDFCLIKSGELVDFISCGFFRSEANWTHAKRNIDSYEIIIMLDEILYIEVEDSRHVLKRGDYLLIPPNHVHQGYQTCPENTRFFWTHFYLGSEMVIDAKRRAQAEKEDPALLLQRGQLLLPHKMEQTDLGKLLLYCNQLCHINEAKSYAIGATDLIMTMLINEINHQYVKKSRDKEYYGNTQKILEWIRINYTSHITVKDVADHFQYSINYMSHYFSKNVGISMQRYITQLRVDKACELLLNTHETVKEIAGQTGFRDSKYFLRIFKQYTHVTPTEYRNAFNRTHYNKM